ncbi:MULTISPECIES: hypothetical protein [Pseudomonas]|uniref:Uncharacterized protein n=2 Tax=Pseudomonas TaxID=286 RepID=A0A2X2EE71_PSELU|nr:MULTISPECIES: hypothetical protein [Pseudomonas]SER22734.1 hypothetical protein SAMN05216409_11490 [Pseudomonas lutea]SPZ04970.1 Uncharacterised protein [Pseudomonas luteola]
MAQHDPALIERNADLILYAGHALQSIAELVAQSDIPEEGISHITQEHRINLMRAVEVIGESLVRRSHFLRTLTE